MPEIEKGTVLQWIGVVSLSLSIPLLMYANQVGARDQQLSELIKVVGELKVAQDAGMDSLKKDLDSIKASVAGESMKNGNNGVVITRIEYDIGRLNTTVIKHGEEIAVLKNKR